MGLVPNGLIFSQRVLVPNDTRGQPVVAGNFVQSIFAPRILISALKFPCLGKLPRPAGWQLRSPESATGAALIGAFPLKPIAC
jgi:hypothetical protein